MRKEPGSVYDKWNIYYILRIKTTMGSVNGTEETNSSEAPGLTSDC